MLELLQQLYHDYLSPEGIQRLVHSYGTLAIATIVFVETGLLIGFFLPGDSLLVTAGIVVASLRGEPDEINIWAMLSITSVAAIVGDALGFLIGAKLGPALFRKDDSLLFKRKHIEKAHSFYERYGGKTIVIARFVPIVRTFAPTVAGAAGMDYRRFALFNVVGGIGWVGSLLLLGYYGATAINSRWGEGTVEKYLHPIIFGVIFLSILPGIIEVIRERRRSTRERAAQASAAANTSSDAKQNDRPHGG
ncbi:MAG: VTT domain-containing protein [Planctomycetes bacterium]|nr:VTT domain-containing protein [Planctomycetota bacterium]